MAAKVTGAIALWILSMFFASPASVILLSGFSSLYFALLLSTSSAVSISSDSVISSSIMSLILSIILSMIDPLPPSSSSFSLLVAGTVKGYK